MYFHQSSILVNQLGLFTEVIYDLLIMLLLCSMISN